MNALMAFTLLAFFCLSSSSPFKDCKSKGAKVISVDISGCDNNAEKCEFQQGSEVTSSIKFKPTEEVKALKANLKVGAFGFFEQIPIENFDACKDLGCPLKINQEYTYSTKFSVPEDALTVSVTAFFNMTDAAEKSIVCVQVPAKITKKAS